MAGGAILRRRLIEEYRFGVHSFRKFVAFCAPHVLVGSSQRECGPLLVVKQRRFPLHAVVTVGAMGGVSLGELLSVDVLVAVLADHGRGLEVDIHELGPEVRRLVAVDAGRGAVGPEQGELRFGVVEPGQFLP